MKNDWGDLPEFVSALLDEVVLPAAEASLKAHGEIAPVVFMGRKNGKAIVTPLSFNNDKEKGKVAGVIRIAVQALDVDYVVFAAESWTLPPEHADEYMKNMDKYRGVSNHPNRVEVYYITVETRDKNYCVSIPLREKTLKMDEKTVLDGGKSEGRFANFMGNKNAH